jgi:hypothetical protein
MVWTFIFLLLFSCSTPYFRESAELMHEQQFEAATAHLTKADLPYQRTNEAPLLLLSRAQVHFHQGNDLKSAHDFEKALDATDYYRQLSAIEMTGQILMHDGLGAYVPPPFEVALARFYQALSWLHLDEEGNAAATLLYLENREGQNPLTTYLLATLLERRGDFSNARILYSRLSQTSASPTLLMVHHRGKAPTKLSKTAPASIVSCALVEKLLQTQNIRPALSSLRGIPVPALSSHHRPKPAPIFVNSQRVAPTLTYDVAQAAQQAVDDEMPTLAAKAAARMLLRRGVVAATKREYQPLADVAMLISNLATEADTRSWASLPACIDVYAVNLPLGEHLLQVDNQEVIISIGPKKIVVVEIFQPTDHNTHLRR